MKAFLEDQLKQAIENMPRTPFGRGVYQGLCMAYQQVEGHDRDLLVKCQKLTADSSKDMKFQQAPK